MPSSTTAVSLRDVLDSDLPIFFEHQRDPQATRMADFPARDHEAFFAHWSKIRAVPANIIKTVLYQGQVAGNICCWPAEDKRLIGYWIGREFWNRGIASAALAQFIKEVPHRPLYAYVAKQNAGSIRVLQKCGFTICAENSTRAHQEVVDNEVLYALSA